MQSKDKSGSARDLGWRKLEERRKEMKVMLDKRLEVLKSAAWLKKMVSKLKGDGGLGWWEEYEVLRRKYELSSMYGSVHSLKKRLK